MSGVQVSTAAENVCRRQTHATVGSPRRKAQLKKKDIGNKPMALVVVKTYAQKYVHGSESIVYWPR